MNWETPIVDLNRGCERTGVYVGHSAWNVGVAQQYAKLVGSDLNYLSGIEKSAVEKIAKNAGIKLTTIMMNLIMI